jgi:hypothetical protein
MNIPLQTLLESLLYPPVPRQLHSGRDAALPRMTFLMDVLIVNVRLGADLTGLSVSPFPAISPFLTASHPFQPRLTLLSRASPFPAAPHPSQLRLTLPSCASPFPAVSHPFQLRLTLPNRASSFPAVSHPSQPRLTLSSRISPFPTVSHPFQPCFTFPA